MNVKKRINTKAAPVTRMKGAGTSHGGPNQASPIKNAVAVQPKPQGYEVARNSVARLKG